MSAELIRSVFLAVKQNCKVTDIIPTLHEILLRTRDPVTHGELHGDLTWGNASSASSARRAMTTLDDGGGGGGVARLFLGFARLLLQSGASVIRLFGLRILRAWVDGRTSILQLIHARVDFLIGMCLELPPGPHVLECVEAVKLVNHVICLDQEHFDSLALLASLTAVARDHDNPCRLICLELLRRVVVNDLRLAAKRSAIDALFAAAMEPTCQSISKTLVLTLLYLLNEPKCVVWLVFRESV
jgi:hypothetical protein